MNKTQLFIIAICIIIIIVVVLWPYLGKLGLGKLPGDILFERKNFKFYFPITTCIIISTIITFILWLLRK